MRLRAGGRTFVEPVVSGSSYLGQHDLRVHFGLADLRAAERIEVAWPAGGTDVLEDVPAGHLITIREGAGETGRVPFAR